MEKILTDYFIDQINSWLRCIYNISMEDEQDLEVTQINESNIFRAKKRSGQLHQRRNSSKSAKQLPLVRILIIIGVTIFIFVLLAKIFDLQNRINTIQSQRFETKSPSSPQNYQPPPNVGTDMASIAKRVSDLEAKVQGILTRLQQIQSKSTQKSSGKLQVTNLASLNSSALTAYVESTFRKHQTSINFLQMHDSEVYYYQKVDFLKSILNTDLLRSYEKAKVSFMQALNNYKIPHFNIHIQNEINDWLNKQKSRLSQEYDFSLEELPFCIVVPTLNNAKNFRYQYNLQSMVNLDYKNFRIVIVDDASTDHTSELIKIWIQQNNISHDIVIVTNEKRRTAVPNIHVAVTQHCKPESIVVLVDGDDELLGRYSLKVFNHVYRKENVDVVYSNHIQFYTHTKQAYRGWSMNYGDDQKKNNRYRDVPQKIAHLRSFKAKLYLKIKEEDLKDQKGEWLTSTYDEVICLPILEMSCGRIVYLEQFFYLYNFGIGTNDLQVDPVLQKNIADYVKYKKKKYGCLNQ